MKIMIWFVDGIGLPLLLDHSDARSPGRPVARLGDKYFIISPKDMSSFLEEVIERNNVHPATIYCLSLCALEALRDW